ncbi:methyl-accepting chemotaxis protein [Lacibacterium aquatile]|uniref:Methyl-accepting chemotaxis protein n=1 Tax=Lacibacterium aquatile TaxID=1168082 RepID=A0ABW5DVS2_9PROT
MNHLSDLDALRRLTGKLMLGLLWFNVVAALLIPQDGWAMELGVAVCALMATVVRLVADEGFAARCAVAVGLIGQISAVLWGLSGHAWQVDIHMAYFAALAVLVTYCDWRVVVLAAAVTAVHHLMLNFMLPTALYPGGADFGRVIVHAIIVVIETASLSAACILLTGLLARAGEQTAAARRAEQAALDVRQAQELDRRTAEDERRNALEDMANRVETEAGNAVKTVAEQGAHLTDLATGMAETAARMRQKSGRVNATAEEVLEAAQSVASATEELSTAVGDIGRRIAETAANTRDANREGDAAAEIVGTLTETVDRIGDVAKLIGDIAGQTNLLALNATIEAARAGDAGKGFAVVASEVKNLATQTHRSTDEISRMVGAIREVTDQVVEKVYGMIERIRAIDSAAATIASAVEQQGAVTAEIARTVGQTADAARHVSEEIGKVAEEASANGTTADELNHIAAKVADDIDSLRQKVIHIVRTSTDAVNRRSKPRYAVNIATKLELRDRSVPVQLVNMSEGGAMAAGYELLEGQQVEAEILILNHRLSVTVKGLREGGVVLKFRKESPAYEAFLKSLPGLVERARAVG